jgi:hypothetical protein
MCLKPTLSTFKVFKSSRDQREPESLLQRRAEVKDPGLRGCESVCSSSFRTSLRRKAKEYE